MCSMLHGATHGDRHPRRVSGAGSCFLRHRYGEGVGCSFVDYDLDGRLDLVVIDYLEFDRTRVPEPGNSGYCQWKGLPVMCGPRGLPFARNYLAQ
jgi:hypothetical protein